MKPGDIVYRRDSELDIAYLLLEIKGGVAHIQRLVRSEAYVAVTTAHQVICSNQDIWKETVRHGRKPGEVLDFIDAIMKEFASKQYDWYNWGGLS
jgi:hypothetical protein